MSGPKPWAIRSARTLHASKWRNTREYHVVAPTGVDAVYTITQLNTLAVGVLPIDDDGHTYLVGQQRFAMGQYSWELPEGGGDPERPALEAAQRELAEEVRLQARHWRPLFDNLQVSNSISDERAFGFLAWGLSPADGVRDAEEDLQVRRMPVRDALRGCLSGEFRDMFTFAILLQADHLARTGALEPELAAAFLD